VTTREMNHVDVTGGVIKTQGAILDLERNSQSSVVSPGLLVLGSSLMQILPRLTVIGVLWSPMRCCMYRSGLEWPRPRYEVCSPIQDRLTWLWMWPPARGRWAVCALHRVLTNDQKKSMPRGAAAHLLSKGWACQRHNWTAT
jgi:hypothetical protein